MMREESVNKRNLREAAQYGQYQNTLLQLCTRKRHITQTQEKNENK